MSNNAGVTVDREARERLAFFRGSLGIFWYPLSFLGKQDQFSQNDMSSYQTVQLPSTASVVNGMND